MRKILLIAAASVVSSFCWGQTISVEPSGELKKFGWMVGEWTATATWDIMGMQMEADMKITAKWDGQFLRQESVFTLAEAFTMTETMMFGYDPEKKEFFSYSFSNMAPVPRSDRGKITDNALVMISAPWAVMGETSVSRSTLTKQSDDQFTIQLAIQEGDSWVTATTAVFRRTK